MLVGASAGISLSVAFVPVVGVISGVALRHEVVLTVPVPVAITAVHKALHTGVGVAAGISVADVAVTASITLSLALALVLSVGVVHAVAVVLAVSVAVSVAVAVTIAVAVAVTIAVAFAVPIALQVTVVFISVAVSHCCCSIICPRACGCVVLCTYSWTSRPSAGTGACAAAAGGSWTLPFHHSIAAAAVWSAVAQPCPPEAHATGAHRCCPPPWFTFQGAAKGPTGLAASSQWPRAGPAGGPTRRYTIHDAGQKGIEHPRTGRSGSAVVGGTPPARHKADRVPVARGV